MITDSERTCELTPTQRVIWYGQTLRPEAPIYNTAYAFRFRQPIDPEAFAKAHQRLIETTDSFRMTFVQANGQPQIHCSESIPGRLERRDARTLTDEKFGALLKENTSRLLDLTTCPWRSTLFEREDGAFVWHLLHHHLLTDGIGFQAVLRRMGSYYQEELAQAPGTPAECVPSFENWISENQPTPCQEGCSDPKSEAHAAQHSRLYSSNPPTGDPAGERHSSLLDQGLNRALETLADDPRFASFSKDLSLNLILLTSIVALLSRIECRSRISIGIANHGRRSPEEMEISGLLISIRAMRVEVDQSESFAELYEKVRDAFFVQAGGNSSESIQTQDFDVTFNFLTSDMTDFAGIQVESEWLYPDCHESANRWRIHFSTADADNRKLTCDFNNESFSSRGKQVAMANLLASFAAFATEPDQAIHSFSLTGPDNTNASILRAPRHEIPSDVNLWKTFEAIAKSSPSAAAIYSNDARISYGELLEAAEKQSEAIREGSPEPGMIVPIIGQRSSAMIQSSLAAMRAGGAFLPIDSRLPDGRIEAIVSDSKGATPIDTENGKLTPEFTDIRASREADTAYLIYTSGTTGIPNGVAVGHRPVMNLLEDMEKRAPLEMGSRCMWWTAVNFDLSIYEVFSAILFGHSLYIPPDEVHMNPEKLFEWIHENQIDSAYLPPFMLDPLKRWLDGHQDFPLKRLLVGVEPIQEELLVSLAKKVAGLQIINGYGPTEATVCTTFYEVDPGFTGTRRTPIGQPITGNRCYVLDQHLNLMPRGTIGELYIAGEGLAHGYWQRPELNEQKFLPDPFHQSPDRELMYKTGDLVRLSDQDQLEFIGRADSQIKLRGQRIEPAEIEQTMAGHPQVHRCLASVEKLAGQDELVCYYTSALAIDKEALYAHASSLLPFQLVPKRFHHFTDFPTTPNGKVDFDKLTEMAAEAALGHSSREIIAAVGPVEEHLLSLWTERFGTDQISTKDSFFQLGGNSLDSMELTVQICKDFDLDIPLHIIFTKPTIADLSADIERRIESEIEGLDNEETDRMLESITAS